MIDMTVENDMAGAFAGLFRHERCELLAALRRDARAQLARASADPEHADVHLFNHRMVVRLLEVINPRGTAGRMADEEAFPC